MNRTNISAHTWWPRQAVWETVAATAINVTGITLWSYAVAQPDVRTASALLWVLSIPLVLSIFHGTHCGLISGVITLLAIRFNLPNPASLQLAATLPALLWLIAAGECRRFWYQRANHDRHQWNKTKQRLEHYSRNYQLLKASHDALVNSEHDVVPHLRGTIRDLKTRAAEIPPPRLSSLGDTILDLFAEHGALQCAGLYEIVRDTHHETLRPQRTLGVGHQLERTDPMLQQALTTQELQFVNAQTLSNQTRYQLCIPFVDSSGVLHAILVAESIRFFALNAEHLTLLTVLSHQCADLLSDQYVSTVLHQHQKALFLAKTQRAQQQAKQCGSQACIVTLLGSNDPNQLDLSRLATVFRDMDTRWLHTHFDTPHSHTNQSPPLPALSVLMPLTTEAEAMSALQRVDRVVEKQTQKTMAHWGIHVLPPQVLIP